MDGTLRVESPLTQRALLSPSRGGCSLHGCFVARLWAAAGPILPHITHPSPTVGRAPQGRGGGVSGQKSNAQKSMLRSCWCQKAEKEAVLEPLPQHMDPPSEPLLMMAFLHQKCTRLFFFRCLCSKSWLSAKLMTVCQLATLFIVYLISVIGTLCLPLRRAEKRYRQKKGPICLTNIFFYSLHCAQWRDLAWLY